MAKVEQNIEFFSEHSNKQSIRRRQGKSLFIKLVLFIAIIAVGVYFKLSFFLLLVISLLYLLAFCLLFRYDSRKFEKKLSLEQESVRKKESLASQLKKLKEEEKIQKALNHFERIPAEFKTIETVSHRIRYMKRGEAQTLEEALYFWEMDENNHSTNK